MLIIRGCFKTASYYIYKKSLIHETKHDFYKIAKVHEIKNHASSIRPLKNKLLTYEKRNVYRLLPFIYDRLRM